MMGWILLLLWKTTSSYLQDLLMRSRQLSTLRVLDVLKIDGAGMIRRYDAFTKLSDFQLRPILQTVPSCYLSGPLAASSVSSYFGLSAFRNPHPKSRFEFPCSSMDDFASIFSYKKNREFEYDRINVVRRDQAKLLK